jgi:Cu+-exporting ATPase
LPVDKGLGDGVFTGTLNQFGLIEVRAEKVGRETTLAQVVSLVAQAQKRKAPLERAADRYARYFLPVVEGAAAIVLVAGYVLGWADVWLRTVAVLVVACPCALVLATPAAVLASMAWLARHGVVIKGGVALERLAECDTFAFDKTGTLTQGRPELFRVVPLGSLSEEDLLRLAATAEGPSRHPLAEVVCRVAAERGLSPWPVTEATVVPGGGVSARWVEPNESRAHTVLVGNRRLMAEQGVSLSEAADAALREVDELGATALLVALDGEVVGVLAARDPVRPEAHDVVHDLKHQKISEFAILTGDRPSSARLVGKKTHIKTVEAELLPVDKARWIQERQAAGRKVAMVGDGINDAPALAQANVGIALGGIGADLAAEAGDVVLLGEPLSVLPDLVRLSRATVAVIRQNIVVFAFGLNAVAITAAGLGVLGPVAAAILHQAGSLLVLLNAMRLLVFGEWKSLAPVRAFKNAGRAIQRLDDRLDAARALDILLGRWRTLMGVGLLVAVCVYATWGFAAIGPNEVGLLRRQGRLVAVLSPGLHLRFPPPLERIDRLEPARLRSIEIGFRSGRAEAGADAVRWESGHGREGAITATRGDEALLMTADGRLVELAATAQFRLAPGASALRAYAFGIAEPELALRALAECAVREVVSRCVLDDLLTSKRQAAELAAARLLEKRVRDYGLGLEIAAVAFQDVHPPLAVVDSYRDVSRAESERERRLNEGETYRAERLARADGEATATLERAHAESEVRTAAAAGAADAFLALQQARLPYPGLSDCRLYGEALAQALAGKAKLVIEPGQGQRRQFLIGEFPAGASLPELKAALPTLSAPGPAKEGPNP